MSTDTTTETPEPGRKRKGRRWLLPTAIGVVALLLGYAMGAGEEDTASASDQTEELQNEVDDLTAEREALQEQLDAGDGGSDETAALDDRATELDEREAALDERAGELDKREAALAEEEADVGGSGQEQENDSDDGADNDGDYSAGQYSFGDVQVYDDGLGDFALRARVTNTGDNRSGVIWTATLFSDGSVVGTLDGTAQDFAADSTITVEFFGTDAYGDWDEVEFQVDSEF